MEFVSSEVLRFVFCNLFWLTPLVLLAYFPKAGKSNASYVVKR